eukprot:TRINITY_DN11875_c0_g1_i7.p1 TRINITY_DN11875_c0_g1~~TRINITY_DN11875_c0_g1_i7.p1  ORF type:complete len:168 (+),score=13.27 TRINITY_DN11875_c0_g1_i7:301-804(+)
MSVIALYFSFAIGSIVAVILFCARQGLRLKSVCVTLSYLGFITLAFMLSYMQRFCTMRIPPIAAGIANSLLCVAFETCSEGVVARLARLRRTNNAPVSWITYCGNFALIAGECLRLSALLAPISKKALFAAALQVGVSGRLRMVMRVLLMLHSMVSRGFIHQAGGVC